MANKLIKSDKNDSTQNQIKEKWFKLSQEFKRKYLINIGFTAVLVVFIVLIYLGINLAVKKAHFRSVDFSTDRIFSLSSEIIDDIQGLENEVEIICIDYTEGSNVYKIAEQFAIHSDKITARQFDKDKDISLFGGQTNISNYQGVVVKCGERVTYIGSSDMYSEDENYNEVSVADQRICSAVRNVSCLEKPVVYLGTGYSNDVPYSVLKTYVENEMIDFEYLDLVSSPEVPQDCKCLILQSPTIIDFTDQTYTIIDNYIKSGGNIIYMQSRTTEAKDFPNNEKLLQSYGIEKVLPGSVIEKDANKLIEDTNTIFFADAQSTILTKNISGVPKLLMTMPSRLVTTYEEGVTSMPLSYTSQVAVFVDSDGNVEDEQTGYLLASIQFKEMEFEDGTEAESQALFLASDLFASDYSIISAPAIQYANNKDFIVNAIGYLADREPTSTASFKSLYNTYTLTNFQKSILQSVVLIIPIGLLLTCINVIVTRRRS